jgi:hypothetical protein
VSVRSNAAALARTVCAALRQLGRAVTARPGPAYRLGGGASAGWRTRRHRAGGTSLLAGADRRRRQLDPVPGDHKIYAERTRHPRSGQLTFLGLTSEIANDADEPSDRPDA